MAAGGSAHLAREARSGLEPWARAELPPPPEPRGLGWLGVVGPGVIVLGMSIGSGEFLLGPAVFVRHGLSLLWVTALAVFLQTVFNMELMRYTLATGEPIFSGFMRTRPGARAWAWFYALLYLVQAGWPAWAANAAGAIFFLVARRLPGAEDGAAVHGIGIASFLACAGVLLVGRRIERTLEALNWVLVVCILGGLLALVLRFVPPATWLAAAAGFAGVDAARGEWALLPESADFFLLAALVAYSGAGGMFNLTLSSWARDKGYGMSRHAGYIPAAVGGRRVNLAHTGFRFTPDDRALARWRGWWRIVSVDQWVVFCGGALLGMALPALLYVTFLEPGTDIQGLGISAVLARAVGERGGPLAAGMIALLGAWVLVKSQLDCMEGMVRSITDILWSGSRRIRAWRDGDVRAVYYAVLGGVVVWGSFALGLAPPIVLLKLGANIAGLVLIVASLHLLYVNTRLLPRELRPPTWRRACLVATALFYAFFSGLSLASLA